MGKHHNTLGIATTANPDEIKKAYRKLCMVHHPDKGGNADTFLRVQEAYDSLTNNPLIQEPIFYNPQQERVRSATINCYGTFINKKGDIELHYILYNMSSAKIADEHYLHINWRFGSEDIDWVLTVPKYLLIDLKYKFTITFRGLDGSKFNHKFEFTDPRSKWTKFWDFIKIQF